MESSETGTDNSVTWYKGGLRFGCTQCGGCCTGSPGYVWVDDPEIEKLAARLNITIEAFVRKYTRKVGGRLSLLEHSRTYDCVFLEGGKRCKVYEDRPKQCKTFPWWPENLSSQEAWEEASRRCEGINQKDAPLVSFEQIQEQR